MGATKLEYADVVVSTRFWVYHNSTTCFRPMVGSKKVVIDVCLILCDRHVRCALAIF
jgi:hypothetical protein